MFKFLKSLTKEQHGAMGVEAGLLLLGFVVASSTLAAAVAITGRSASSISTEAVEERVTELLPVIKVKGMIIGTRGGDGQLRGKSLNECKNGQYESAYD